jgi:hypothetical protein
VRRPIFIPNEWRSGRVATVNREKDPKMKMAQEVLRHCFELIRALNF